MTGTDVKLDCRIPTGNCGLNATLDVPPDTALQLATGGGNMQVGGIQRDVTWTAAAATSRSPGSAAAPTCRPAAAT